MSMVHVLANPTAGRGHGPDTLTSITNALRALGADPVLVDAPTRASVVGVVQRAVDDGATRLVVVGGDGLVHLAAQVLASTKVALGLVPVGTGNDFARALQIPTGRERAIEHALGEPVAIDAMRTNHGWIASVGTIGFSAAVNARANRLRHPRGRARYTIATLRELPALRPLPVRITVDGAVRECELALAAIANTRFFGGGMAVCPHADPTDGHLDVALVGAVGRATLLRFLPRVFRGTHTSHPAVTMLTGRRIRIELTDEGGRVARDAGLWGDGESVGALPVDIEVVPQALHVAGVHLSHATGPS